MVGGQRMSLPRRRRLSGNQVRGPRRRCVLRDDASIRVGDTCRTDTDATANPDVDMDNSHPIAALPAAIWTADRRRNPGLPQRNRMVSPTPPSDASRGRVFGTPQDSDGVHSRSAFTCLFRLRAREPWPAISSLRRTGRPASSRPGHFPAHVSGCLSTGDRSS